MLQQQRQQQQQQQQHQHQQQQQQQQQQQHQQQQQQQQQQHHQHHHHHHSLPQAHLFFWYHSKACKDSKSPCLAPLLLWGISHVNFSSLKRLLRTEAQGSCKQRLPCTSCKLRGWEDVVYSRSSHKGGRRLCQQGPGLGFGISSLELVLRRQLEIIPNVPSTALSPPATRYIMLFVGSSPLLLSSALPSKELCSRLLESLLRDSTCWSEHLLLMIDCS